MKKVIVSIFIFVFLFALSASATFACTCALSFSHKSFEKQVKKAYKESTVVFFGEVLEIVQKPNDFFVKVKFKLEKSWNKSLSSEVTIATGLGSADCGYHFIVNEKYLVYAFGKPDDLVTNICTRTEFLKSNKDIAVLNKIKKTKS